MKTTGFAEEQHPRVGDGTFTTKGQGAPEVALTPSGDNYIEVEGGLVTNNPSLPVIDLDFLKDYAEDIELATSTYNTAARLGLGDYAERVANWGVGVEGWVVPDTEINPVRADDGDFVHLEGGLVQNSPDLPVIDLDVLDGPHGTEEFAEARATLEVARELGLTEIVERIEEWLNVA